MAIGIYKIVNTINDKFYIGSSRRLSERKAEHNYSLRKSHRGNSIIKNAVLKYGIENFKFEIVEEFVFDDFADINYINELITSREQYYVDILNPEYNIQKEDVTCSKCVFSRRGKVLKYKISIREYNRLFPKNYGRKKIDVYKRDNLEFVETISGVRRCADLYKLDSSSIAKMCKKGYKSRYKGEYLFCYNGDTITNKLRPNISSKGYKRKNNIKPVVQIDKFGNFIKEWRTGSDAEQELKLYKGSISRVISGKNSNTKGYYFKNKEYV